MADLSLGLLGTPVIMRAGRQLHFPTRKSQALLIYLVVEGGLHAREHLISLFWPDSDPRRGRAALRNTLARLRDALVPARAGQLPDIVLIDGDRLGLDPEASVAVDLATVEGALNRLRAGSADLAALLPVRDLCRGDFLDGFSLADAPGFDDWASLQRERWHQRLAAFLAQLCEEQTKAGDLPGAVETAQRWVAHDRLSEAAARQLMRGLFAIGDREAALRAYQAIGATLQAELQAEPSPEIEAIYARLRGPVPAPPRLIQTNQAKGQWLTALEAPLVGRAVPLAEMIACYHSAAQGRAQAVVIEGEAGIGKSRLADEFVRWAAAQGAMVLTGRAFEAGGRLPYQAFVEALRPHLADADLLNLAGERRLTVLSRLLPELRDRFPSLPVAAGDDQEARLELFEAVSHVIQALAGRAPLVLYLDDWQWADTASLDLLRHQARRWVQAPEAATALLVLTVRRESLTLSPALAEWLATLARDLSLARLDLGPLGEVDTREWLQALTGRPADPAFLRWLYDDTRGQPFYVAETLKALVERGVLSPVNSGGRWTIQLPAAGAEPAPSGWMPPSVQEVIRTRLAQLNAGATALLGAGAVLGQRLSFEHLLRVARLTEADGLRALDELLARRLLLETDDPGRPYVFAHDKIRDVAYTEAGAARRRIFHRRAFEVLERSGAPAPELSHQALAAGLGLPAFQWSLAAGDEALRLFAVREAATHYRQAEQVLQRHSGPRTAVEPERQAHLYLQMGRAYELLNDWAPARTAYEALLELSRSARDTAGQCLALNRLATIAAWNTFDMPLAEGLLAEACSLAERTGDRAGLAETEWNLAQLGIYQTHPDSLAHARRALSLARELDRPELVARALNAVAHATLGTGRWAEVQAAADESVSLFHQLGNRALEADSLAVMADALSNLGQLPAGLAAARAAYAISQEIGNAWGQVFSATALSLIMADLGDYGEALSLARRNRELAAGLGFPNLSFLNLVSLIVVALSLGQVDEAETYLQQAAALNERTGNLRPYAEGLALMNCARLAWHGRWDEALPYARQAVAVHEKAYLLSVSQPAWAAVEALGRAGERRAALAYADSFARRAGPSPRTDLAQELILAALASTQGARDEALVHLAAAAELAEGLGLLGEQWRIAVQRCALYSSAGDRAQADVAAAQAARLRQTLAERLADPELRAAYLAQPTPAWAMLS